jgi:hypothetical protein
MPWYSCLRVVALLCACIWSRCLATSDRGSSMVNEHAGVVGAVAWLKTRLKQEGFHLPLGPEANQRKLFEVVTLLLSEQLVAQLRDLRAMNDSRESWLGRGWTWEQSHSNDSWWPPMAELEPARAAQREAWDEALKLVGLAQTIHAAFARLVDAEGGETGVPVLRQPPAIGILLDLVDQLIEEYRRTARHFAVLRAGNTLFELRRLKLEADPGVIEEALNNLVEGEFHKPIDFRRISSHRTEFYRGRSSVARMLGLPHEGAVKHLATEVLRQTVPDMDAATPAEMIQDLKTKLNALIGNALIPSLAEGERRAWEADLGSNKTIQHLLPLHSNRDKFDASVALRSAVVSEEVAKGGNDVLQLLRAAVNRGQLVELARSAGKSEGWARKKLFDTRRRLKRRVEAPPRFGSIRRRFLATTGWVSGFANFPGHGRVSVGDVLSPSGLRGRRYSRAGVIGIEVGFRSVDLDVLTAYQADIEGPISAPQEPSVVAFCPSCGESLGAHGGGRRCVASTQRGPQLCPGCGRPTCSHSPWCRAGQHQHHFKRQGAGKDLVCVECAATLPAAEVELSTRR